MHDIEPFYKWRDQYVASEDRQSPFYGRSYNEFLFTQKIYNYFIHPQWDDFGSSTLYMKILYVDYDDGYCCIELIGEWNDCISNDVMLLKREIADELMLKNINKFILFCDNVLNFHGSDDCYYEEWAEDAMEEQGWICLVNTMDHVLNEMKSYQLHHYIHLGKKYNNINWRSLEPKSVYLYLLSLMEKMNKQITY